MRGTPPPPPPRVGYPLGGINLMGVALALIGAVTMVVALFLPRVESTAFSLAGVQENTLIQSGNGSLTFVGCALGIVAATYAAIQKRGAGWAIVVLGVLALALAISNGTSDDALTLYRLDQSGNPNMSEPSSRATPGIGIYAAGLGGALAIWGGFQVAMSRRRGRP